MPRRSKLETYIEIMAAISQGASKPTHVMYRANLAWSSMQEHLEFLLAQGLIMEKRVGARRRYELTENGYRTLGYFRKVRKALCHEEISRLKT